MKQVDIFVVLRIVEGSWIYYIFMSVVVLTAADRLQRGLGQIVIQETVESCCGVDSNVRVRVLPSICELFHSLRPPQQQFKE